MSTTSPAPKAISAESLQKRRLLRVGLFAVIGFLITAIGVFVIGDRQNLFGDTFKIGARFANTDGLFSGAAVVLNGIRVGSVSTVELAFDTTTYVHVGMTIEEEYRNMIRTSSQATLSQVGIVGDKQIAIETSDFDAPVVEDGALIGSIPPPNYFAVLEKAEEAVANVTHMTASLDTLFLRFARGEGTLGKLLTDDRAYENLVEVSASADRLFAATTDQFVELGTVLQRTAENVDGISVESRRLISDLGAGKGTVGALLYDRSLYDSLESLVGSLGRTSDNAGMAAREFAINMRGLRSSWLLGGLFSGGEEAEASTEMRDRELELMRAELERQELLLRQREQEAAARD